MSVPGINNWQYQPSFPHQRMADSYVKFDKLMSYQPNGDAYPHQRMVDSFNKTTNLVNFQPDAPWALDRKQVSQWNTHSALMNFQLNAPAFPDRILANHGGLPYTPFFPGVGQYGPMGFDMLGGINSQMGGFGGYGGGFGGYGMGYGGYGGFDPYVNPKMEGLDWLSAGVLVGKALQTYG